MGQSLHAFAMGSQFEAQIAHDYLTDNGIRCVVRCDEIPLRPGFSFGLEGWGSLLVQAHDALEAREMLALIPGVGQADEDYSGDTHSVSGAFKLKLASVWGVAFILLLWPFIWQFATWYLLPLTGWGAENNQYEKLMDIVIVIANFGVFPLVGLILILTNSHVLASELKRAMPALLAAIVLVVIIPFWLVLQVFDGIRRAYLWLAKLT